LDRNEELTEADKSKKESEATQLKESIKRLNKQLQPLNLKKEMLKITSPIDGRVVTSNVQERLGSSRPVNRGENLLEITEYIEDLKRDGFSDKLAVPNVEQVKVTHQFTAPTVPQHVTSVPAVPTPPAPTDWRNR